jgi:hypothetical protein
LSVSANGSLTRLSLGRPTHCLSLLMEVILSSECLSSECNPLTSAMIVVIPYFRKWRCKPSQVEYGGRRRKINVPDLSTIDVGGIRWLRSARNHLIRNHRAHANNIQAFISETTTWTSNTIEHFLVVRSELPARKGSWSSMSLHCTTVHAVTTFIRTTRSRPAVILHGIVGYRRRVLKRQLPHQSEAATREGPPISWSKASSPPRAKETVSANRSSSPKDHTPAQDQVARLSILALHVSARRTIRSPRHQ